MTAFIKNGFDPITTNYLGQEVGNAVDSIEVPGNTPLPPSKSLPINPYESVATQLKAQLGLDDSLLATDAIKKIPFEPMKEDELEDLFQLLTRDRVITGAGDLLAVKATYADILLNAWEDAETSGQVVEEIYLVGSEAPCVLHTYITNTLERWGIKNAYELTSDLRKRKQSPRLDGDFSFDMPGIPTRLKLGEQTKKFGEFLQAQSQKPVSFSAIWKDGFRKKCMPPWTDDNPVKFAMVTMEQMDPLTHLKGPHFEVKFVKSNNGASFFECDSFRVPLKSFLQSWKYWRGRSPREFLEKNAENLNIEPTAKLPFLTETKENAEKDSMPLHQAIIDELTGTIREKNPKAHDLVGWVRQLTKTALGLRRIDRSLGAQSTQCDDGLYAEICRRARDVFPEKIFQGKIYLTLMACHDLLTHKKDNSADFIVTLLKQLTSDSDIEKEGVVKDAIKNSKDHLLAIWEELKDPKKLQGILAVLTLSGFQALTSSSKDLHLSCTLSSAHQNEPMLDILVEDFHLPLPLDLETACQTLLDCEALPSIALLERLYGKSQPDLCCTSSNALTDTLIEYAQQFANSASPFHQHLAMPLFLQGWALDPSRNLDTTFLNLFNKTLRTDQKYLTDLALAKKLVKGIDAHKTVDDWLTFVPQIPQDMKEEFSDLRNRDLPQIFRDCLNNSKIMTASELTKLYRACNGFVSSSKDLASQIAQMVIQTKSQPTCKELQELIVHYINSNHLEEATTVLTKFPEKQSRAYRAAQLHYTAALCKQDDMPLAECLGLLEDLSKNKKWSTEQTQILVTCREQVTAYVMKNLVIASAHRQLIATVFHQENLIQALDNEIQLQKQLAFEARLKRWEEMFPRHDPDRALKLLEHLIVAHYDSIEECFHAKFLSWANDVRTKIDLLRQKQEEEVLAAKLQAWKDQLPSSTPKDALKVLEDLAKSHGSTIEKPPFQAKFFNWLDHPQTEANLLAKTIEAHLPFLLSEHPQWLTKLFESLQMPSSLGTRVFVQTRGKVPSSEVWHKKIAGKKANHGQLMLAKIMVVKGSYTAVKMLLRTFEKDSLDFFKLSIAFARRFSRSLKSSLLHFEQMTQLPVIQEPEAQILLKKFQQHLLEKIGQDLSEAAKHQEQILRLFKLEELPKALQTSFCAHDLAQWKANLPAQTSLKELHELEQIAGRYGLEVSTLSPSFNEWLNRLSPEVNLFETIKSYWTVILAEHSEWLKIRFLTHKPEIILKVARAELEEFLTKYPVHTLSIHEWLSKTNRTYPQSLQLLIAKNLSKAQKEVLAKPLWLDLLEKDEVHHDLLNEEDRQLIFEKAIDYSCFPTLYCLLKNHQELPPESDSAIRRAYRLIETHASQKTNDHAALIKFMESVELRCPDTFTRLLQHLIKNTPDSLAPSLFNLYWSQVENRDLALTNAQRKSLWEALWKKNPNAKDWIYRLASQTKEKSKLFFTEKWAEGFLIKVLDVYTEANLSYLKRLYKNTQGVVSLTLSAKLYLLYHGNVGSTAIKVVTHYGHFKTAMRPFIQREHLIPASFNTFWEELMQAVGRLETNEITDAFLKILLNDVEKGQCLGLSPLPAYAACIKKGMPNTALDASQKMTAHLLKFKKDPEIDMEYLKVFFEHLASQRSKDYINLKEKLQDNERISHLPKKLTCLLKLSELRGLVNEIYDSTDPKVMKRCTRDVLPVIETRFATVEFAEALGHSAAYLYCLNNDREAFKNNTKNFFKALATQVNNPELNKSLIVSFSCVIASQFIHFVANYDENNHLLEEAWACIEGMYQTLLEGYESTDEDVKLASDTFNILQTKVLMLSPKKHEAFLEKFKKTIDLARGKGAKIVKIPTHRSWLQKILGL